MLVLVTPWAYTAPAITRPPSNPSTGRDREINPPGNPRSACQRRRDERERDPGLRMYVLMFIQGSMCTANGRDFERNYRSTRDGIEPPAHGFSLFRLAIDEQCVGVVHLFVGHVV